MASCTATVAPTSLSLQCVTVDTGDHHKVNAGVITALCYSNGCLYGTEQLNLVCRDPDAAQAGSKDLACSAPTSVPCAEPCSPSCSEGTTVSTNACSAQAQPPSPQRGTVHSNPSTPRTPRSTRTFSIEPDPAHSDASTSDSASPGASSEAQVLRQQLASALVRLAAAERQRDAWAAKYREASYKASVLSQRYEGLARYIAIALHQRHQQHRSRLSVSRTPRLRAIHESSAAEATALASASSLPAAAPVASAASTSSAAAGHRSLSIRFSRSRPSTPPKMSPRGDTNTASTSTVPPVPEAGSTEAMPPARQSSADSDSSSSSSTYRSAAQMPALLPPLDVHPCEEDELEESLLEELQRCADRVGPSSPTQRLAAKQATRPYGLAVMQASSAPAAAPDMSVLEDGTSSSTCVPSRLDVIPEQWHDASEAGTPEASVEAEPGSGTPAEERAPSRTSSAGGSPRRVPRAVASAVSPFADAAAPLEVASGAQTFTNGSVHRGGSWHANAAADAAAAIERATSGIHAAAHATANGSSNGSRAHAALVNANGSSTSASSNSRARTAAAEEEEEADGEEEHWSMQQPKPPTVEEVERARRRLARRWSQAIADAVCSLEPWAGALEGLPLANSLKQELRHAWEEQQEQRQQAGQGQGRQRQQQQEDASALTWWDVGKDVVVWATGKMRQSSAVDVAKTAAVTGLAVWALSYAWGPRRRKRSSLLY